MKNNTIRIFAIIMALGMMFTGCAPKASEEQVQKINTKFAEWEASFTNLKDKVEQFKKAVNDYGVKVTNEDKKKMADLDSHVKEIEATIVAAKADLDKNKGVYTPENAEKLIGGYADAATVLTTQAMQLQVQIDKLTGKSK